MPQTLQVAERMTTVSSLQALDAHAGASLDRITRLVAFSMRTPVAFVSIVGVENQRFVSRVGLEMGSTDIRYSICSYAMESRDVFVVPDLAADARFSQHPLLTGTTRLRSYAGAPLIAKNGVPIGAVCVMDKVPREFDANEREQLRTLAEMVMNQLELRTMAGRQDPVSGLPNRHQFHIDYEGHVGRMSGQARLYAVMLDVLDVPRFTEAGQALGMPPLEAMIHRCSVRVRMALEGIAELYQVGVSRFAFMAEFASDEDVSRLMAELKRRVVRPIMAAAIPMSPQFHAGVCIVDPAEDAGDDIIRKLLVGLQASISARSDFCWYSERRDERLRRGYRLAADAERALFRQEFSLQFQPRFDARTRRAVGAEALIRWTHPRLGPVGPGEFIPIFERTAVMPLVTSWVLDQALDQLALWRGQALDLQLSINLSPSDLDRPDAALEILQRLADRGLPTALLEVEVTEGEWVRENSPGTEQLRQLAAAGVRVAIDDFGSGYSNFGYLSKLPISIIKIDKSLIDGVATHPHAVLKIKAIVQLAAGLGYRTVAEGVETEAQADVLTGLGCDELQGYFLARPMGGDDIERSVRDAAG